MGGIIVSDRTTVIYHGSSQIVKSPKLLNSRYTKDFATGFYCTDFTGQAERWAIRFGGKGYVSYYVYTPNPNLRIKVFPEMTEEWLDFIVACRKGETHPYDIVEGPMADDQIYNYIQDFLSGEITRAAFWELAKFRHPTHQISFHTEAALSTLKYENYYEVG